MMRFINLLASVVLVGCTCQSNVIPPPPIPPDAGVAGAAGASNTPEEPVEDFCQTDRCFAGMQCVLGDGWMLSADKNWLIVPTTTPSFVKVTMSKSSPDVLAVVSTQTTNLSLVEYVEKGSSDLVEGGISEVEEMPETVCNVDFIRLNGRFGKAYGTQLITVQNKVAYVLSCGGEQQALVRDCQPLIESFRITN